jgi:hypothetical protein
VDSASGRTFPTLNPTNEKKIADIAEADKVDSLNLNIHFVVIIVIIYTASKNKITIISVYFCEILRKETQCTLPASRHYSPE